MLTLVTDIAEIVHDGDWFIPGYSSHCWKQVIFDDMEGNGQAVTSDDRHVSIRRFGTFCICCNIKVLLLPFRGVENAKR
jgi:hypothetical protein